MTIFSVRTIAFVLAILLSGCASHTIAYVEKNNKCQDGNGCNFSIHNNLHRLHAIFSLSGNIYFEEIEVANEILNTLCEEIKRFDIESDPNMLVELQCLLHTLSEPSVQNYLNPSIISKFESKMYEIDFDTSNQRTISDVPPFEFLVQQCDPFPWLILARNMLRSSNEACIAKLWSEKLVEPANRYFEKSDNAGIALITKDSSTWECAHIFITRSVYDIAVSLSPKTK